jgi:hypothetical protein
MLLGTTTPVPGLVIDTFDTQQHVAAGWMPGSWMDLAFGSDMIGGTRLLWVDASSVGGSAASTGGGELTFTNGGLSEHFVCSRYTADDAGLGHIDLTEGGTRDAFEVIVISSALTGRMDLIVGSDFSPDQPSQFASECSVMVGLGSAPRAMRFSYEDFIQRASAQGPADFTSIETVWFRFLPDESAPDYQELRIGAITTTPEPSTCLGGLVLVSITTLRTRWRAHHTARRKAYEGGPAE